MWQGTAINTLYERSHRWSLFAPLSTDQLTTPDGLGVSLHVDAPEVWTRLWCWSVGMILMMTSCNNIGDEFLRRLTPDNWSRAVRLSWEEISLISSELSSHWLLNRFPVPSLVL